MTALQVLTWAEVATMLLKAGIATGQQIATIIKSIHGPQMTEAELNEICAWVISDAARRKALAEQDAAGGV